MGEVGQEVRDRCSRTSLWMAGCGGVEDGLCMSGSGVRTVCGWGGARGLSFEASHSQRWMAVRGGVEPKLWEE